MPKSKRVVKSKEEIVKELQKSQEFKKNMAFTKDQHFPALIKASRNVDDAKMLLSSINSILMEKFLQKMKDVKFSEFKLHEALDPEDEKYEFTFEWVHLFDDMSVYDAKALLEGMKSEINLFIDEEMKERTLDTLKTRWLDDVIDKLN